jgi:aminopeptidase N
LKKYFKKYFEVSLLIHFAILSSNFLSAQSLYNISELEKKSFIKSENFIFKYTDLNIDVKYYKLFVDVRLNPKYIYGETTINGVLLNTADSIYFDFSNAMAVDSVKYNGAGVNFNHFRDKISVHPVKNLIKNNDFSVVISYHGLPVQTGFGSFIFNTHNNTSVIWSLSEPYGASDWFPCKNAQSDKADSSDVWIKCSSSFTGVSNGVLKEVIENPDSTKIFKWKNSYPIANYLLSIAVTNYSLYTNYFKYSSTDSMPVMHYMYPEEIESLKPTLYKTVGMLKMFSDKFGLYPFIREKYGHSQTGISGAMEHQTVTSIGVIDEYIIAHELAHQWFGDKITCRDWHNIWLNEGFATYSECIYAENAYGKPTFDQFISSKMNDAKRAIGTIYVEDISSVSNIFDSRRSYAKGGMVLHMLRGIVGDTTFYNILKTYSSDSVLSYSTAVTDDFKNIAEKVSGIQLNYFFNEWINGENYPVYFISWVYNQKENNVYNVTLELNQKENSNPKFFTMPIELKVNTSNGDTILHFFNNSLKQVFNFDVNGFPKLLTLDPGNKILKDKYGDYPKVIVGYNLDQNYPNPFNPNTTIKYEIAGYVDVKITVYDALGRQMLILVDEKQKPGKYSIIFDSKNFASGVYFYKINAGNYSSTRKMILLR